MLRELLLNSSRMKKRKNIPRREIITRGTITSAFFQSDREDGGRGRGRGISGVLISRGEIPFRPVFVAIFQYKLRVFSEPGAYHPLN